MCGRSAGLFFAYGSKSTDYIAKYKSQLATQPTLLAFSLAPDELRHKLSHGLRYCGFTLNTWRTANRTACISSFSHFNIDEAQYNQLVWMANVFGAGVWTQSGDPDAAPIDVGHPSPQTNEKGPLVEQNTPGRIDIAYRLVSLWSTIVFLVSYVCNFFFADASDRATRSRLYWPPPELLDSTGPLDHPPRDREESGASGSHGRWICGSKQLPDLLLVVAVKCSSEFVALTGKELPTDATHATKKEDMEPNPSYQVG